MISRMKYEEVKSFKNTAELVMYGLKMKLIAL